MSILIKGMEMPEGREREMNTVIVRWWDGYIDNINEILGGLSDD